MQILSGLDNVFLSQDKKHQQMHVAGLGIYDQSTAQGGAVRFKTILEFFESRLVEFPIFRRRLIYPPLGMERPFLIDVNDVDIEYHVRHIGLPHPGDWRQLMIQVARIHSRPLDKTKPLWEAYVIEGLDNIPNVKKGSFALYIKCHHAVVDGQMGAQILQAFHSFTADFEQPKISDLTNIIVDHEPSNFELIAKTLEHKTNQLFGASKLLFGLTKNIIPISSELTQQSVSISKEWAHKYLGLGEETNIISRPYTRFNDDISPQRTVDAVGISLADCKTIREKVQGTTINDIFLTVIGGAMDKYLKEKGEKTETSLITAIPISIRTENSTGSDGNQVGMSNCSLKTKIADPLERLIAIAKETDKIKISDSPIGADFQVKLMEILPGNLASSIVSYSSGNSANIVISNVRGPSQELYLAGAKMQMYIPISVPVDGLGLNITGFSYNGVLWVAITCCRAMLPDPSFFTDLINKEVQALLDTVTEG